MLKLKNFLQQGWMHITPNPIEMIDEATYASNQKNSGNVYSDSYFHNVFQMAPQGKIMSNGRPPVPPNPPSPMPFNVRNGTLRKVNRNGQLVKQQVKN